MVCPYCTGKIERIKCLMLAALFRNEPQHSDSLLEMTGQKCDDREFSRVAFAELVKEGKIRIQAKPKSSLDLVGWWELAPEARKEMLEAHIIKLTRVFGGYDYEGLERDVPLSSRELFGETMERLEAEGKIRVDRTFPFSRRVYTK